MLRFSIEPGFSNGCIRSFSEWKYTFASPCDIPSSLPPHFNTVSASLVSLLFLSPLFQPPPRPAKYYFWISPIFLTTPLLWPVRQCLCMIWSSVFAGWPGGWLGDTCILRDQWQARRYAFSAGHLVAASWQLGKSNSTWCFSAADGPNKWVFKLQETHGPPVVQACYKGWTFHQGKEVRSWKQSCQKPGRQRDFFF